jgi:hypothetical protein
VQQVAWCSLLGLMLVGVGAGPAVAAEVSEVELAAPTGETVGWKRWLEVNGPAAVVLWAPWVPGAEAALDRIDELGATARNRGLELVIVVVQEPLEESRKALAGRRVNWLHDRYGRLLKIYRVVEVPRLLIVDSEGALLRSGAVNPEGLTPGGPS